MNDHVVAVDIRVPFGSPEEVEIQVTNPLEAAMKSLADLRAMNSSTTHERCKLELAFGRAPSLETVDIVQKAIEAIRPQLKIAIDVMSISIRPSSRS